MKKATKKKATSLKLTSPKKEKPSLVNFKVSKKDLAAIHAAAKKYANGNVSFWLRHAGMNYVPKRKDLSPT